MKQPAFAKKLTMILLLTVVASLILSGMALAYVGTGGGIDPYQPYLISTFNNGEELPYGYACYMNDFDFPVFIHTDSAEADLIICDEIEPSSVSGAKYLMRIDPDIDWAWEVPSYNARGERPVIRFYGSSFKGGQDPDTDWTTIVLIAVAVIFVISRKQKAKKPNENKQ